MVNTVTAAIMVNGATFSDYIAADIYLAVQNCYIFMVGKKPTITSSGTLGTIDFLLTDENDASVLSEFAALQLQNARRHSKSKQSDQTPISLAKIWNDNPELENQLLVGEEANEDNIISTFAQPSNEWYNP